MVSLKKNIKGTELKGGSSAPNNTPPYDHEEVTKEN